MSKKTFATIGMIVCVAFVVMGFITMGRYNDCSTAARSGIYDSGFTTFGADFYTFSNNNTAEAASAARITANNIGHLYDLIADVFGWLFVFAGLIGFCHFGIVRAGCKDAAMPAVSAPVEDSAEEINKDDVQMVS